MKLNYEQLAFILDIKPIEAIEKIISVYCKTQGKTPPPSQDRVKDYTRNNWPESMDIGLLALHLNLPTLQQSVEDIRDNYLTRTATKRWILCDYPEKELKRCYDKGSPLRTPFPKALESLLPVATADVIREEWRNRFPKARVV
jgi:hypothetical protein